MDELGPARETTVRPISFFDVAKLANDDPQILEDGLPFFPSVFTCKRSCSGERDTGLIELTLILYFPHSRAAFLVSEQIASLVMPYPD
jgi:hypothetical protein